VKKKREETIKVLGAIALSVVIVFSLAVIVSFAFWGSQSFKNIEGLTTAFAGAFFAYILVKFGELFTRLSQREKLNIDTLVDVEYLLNDHFGKIALNIKLLDNFLSTVKVRAISVNYMKFEHIPLNKAKLRDLKNGDLINDLFNYYSDIENLNKGLKVIEDFSKSLVNSVSQTGLGVNDIITVSIGFDAGIKELEDMIETSKKMLAAAEKDCEELLAKSRFVYERRNWWLGLGGSFWEKVGRYNRGDLETELPKLIKEVKKERTTPRTTHVNDAVEKLVKRGKSR